MERDKRPPLVEGERNIREIGRIEAELTGIEFPASKRTLVDALGDKVVHYGGETLELDRVIGEMEAAEFNSPDEFLRDLGDELARRILD